MPKRQLESLENVEIGSHSNSWNNAGTKHKPSSIETLCVACLYDVRLMPRCCSFITIVDHGFGSWLGYHHQYDYECNSTGTNIALFYFGMAIFSLPGHAIRDGSH